MKQPSRKHLIGLILAIAIEFTLGIILTTLIDYDASAPTTLQTAFLVAHIIVAIGITFGAVAQFITSLQTKVLVNVSSLGLLSVLGCLVTGSVAAQNGADIAVFGMAFCFLVAFMSYGFIALRTPAVTR